MLVPRGIYNAAVSINKTRVIYEPGNATHEVLIRHGVARISPVASRPGRNETAYISLTQKGKDIVQME